MARSFSAAADRRQPDRLPHRVRAALTDAEHRPVVEASLAALSEDPAVAQVANPLQEGSTAVSARRQDRLLDGPAR